MDQFRFQVNPQWQHLPHCNAVLNGHVGRRPYHVDSYRTTLCLKSVSCGRALYRTLGASYLVDSENFLVLNDGQEYALEIEAGSRTETVCPFFQRGFLGQAARCRDQSDGARLDDPFARGPDPGFFVRLYASEGSRVAARLRLLQAGLHSSATTGPWLEDFFYGLAGDMLDLRDVTRREVAAFPGSRPATREELYRRLHRARDYIDSCYGEKLSVEAVARVAHLSPYHFHRTFRLAFGVTPMRHLQARRLRAASRLLTATDRPVTAVALEVGFESLGSFSSLFREHFGLSPRAFRAARGVR
jgi:AraC-like DNA-binding protein